MNSMSGFANHTPRLLHTEQYEESYLTFVVLKPLTIQSFAGLRQRSDYSANATFCRLPGSRMKQRNSEFRRNHAPQPEVDREAEGKLARKEFSIRLRHWKKKLHESKERLIPDGEIHLIPVIPS